MIYSDQESWLIQIEAMTDSDKESLLIGIVIMI